MKAITYLPGIRGVLMVLVTSLFLFLPAKTVGQNLMDMMENQSKLKLFAGAVKHAGLDQQLSQDGPFTIFAPTDNSFASVYDAENQGNPAKLKRIILNHMITGLATKRKLKMMNNIPTLGGIHLKMKSTNGDLQINKAVVIQANIKASNGVIHIVDELLQ